MRAILIFLSSLLALVSINAKAIGIGTDSIEGQPKRYSFQIETAKAAISGILIAKESESAITGSMVNEFGISAISFVYDKMKDKVKLVNVVSFLDKWYIKMVLKNDIRFCIHKLYDMPDNKESKYTVEIDNDTTVITNPKRHLKYSFTPLTVSENYDTKEPAI